MNNRYGNNLAILSQEYIKMLSIYLITELKMNCTKRSLQLLITKLSLFFLLLLPTILSAQVDTSWIREYTGIIPMYVHDVGYDLDGNCYTVFCGANADGEYMSAIKYDSAGIFQWYYQSVRAALADAVIDSAGNIYMTGWRWVPAGHTGLTIKLDPSGTPVFIYDWPSINDKEAIGVAITCDKLGNCYTAGKYYNTDGYVDENYRKHSYEDDIVVKGYNAGGGQIFETLINNMYHDGVGDITVSPSDDIYVTGTSELDGWDAPNQNTRLYKLSSAGGRLWDKTFDYSLDADDLTIVTCDTLNNSIMTLRPSVFGGGRIFKHTSDGTQLWENVSTRTYSSLLTTPDNKIYTVSGSYISRYDDSLGNILWETDISSMVNSSAGWVDIQDMNHLSDGVVVTGKYGYSTDGQFIAKVDSLGSIKWIEEYDIGDGRYADMYSKVASNDSGSVLISFLDNSATYWNYKLITIKYLETAKKITVRDANNDTIPNSEFELIRITSDPDPFTEDSLGTFTTDSTGKYEFEVGDEGEIIFHSDTLNTGDTIKIAKHVDTETARKHPILLPTMYSVHLDNAKFDEDGVMSYDTLTADNKIVLDHSEFRFNLVVSVQWDADLNYLNSLEESFGLMSNYLYDVTDGQVRLDTVMIYDTENHWLEADMQVFASNMEWPRAYVFGIYGNTPGQSILFP